VAGRAKGAPVMFPYRASRAIRRQMSVLVTLGTQGQEGIGRAPKKRLNMEGEITDPENFLTAVISVRRTTQAGAIKH